MDHELEAHSVYHEYTNREIVAGHPLAWRCGKKLLNVQLFGAALRLPQIMGKLHLQPMLRRASERLGYGAAPALYMNAWICCSGIIRGVPAKRFETPLIGGSRTVLAGWGLPSPTPAFPLGKR